MYATFFHEGFADGDRRMDHSRVAFDAFIAGFSLPQGEKALDPLNSHRHSLCFDGGVYGLALSLRGMGRSRLSPPCAFCRAFPRGVGARMADLRDRQGGTDTKKQTVTPASTDGRILPTQPAVC